MFSPVNSFDSGQRIGVTDSYCCICFFVVYMNVHCVERVATATFAGGDCKLLPATMKKRASTGGSGPSAARRRVDNQLVTKQAGSKWAEYVEKVAVEMSAKGFHPAQWAVDRFGSPGDWHNKLRECIEQHLQMNSSAMTMPALSSVSFPVTSTRDPLRVPIDAMAIPQPALLPPMIDWMVHFRSVLHTNFDSRREPVDIRPMSTSSLGHPLTAGVMVPIKGFTRCSILFFILAQVFEMPAEDGTCLEAADHDLLTRFAQSETFICV